MKHLRKFTPIILIAVMLPAPLVSALNPTQKQLLDNGIYYFDADTSQTCATDVGVNLSGNNHIQQAYNFFVGQGLTPAQSAAIVGNMWWESSVNPEKIQDPGGTSQNPNDAGSAGWGIVQWTPGSKALDLAKAANISTPIYDLATQLNIVWAQLTRLGGLEQQAGTDIKNAPSVVEAVRAFQGDQNIGGKYVGFERPKDESATLQARIDRANAVLAQYGNSTGGTTVSAPSSLADCSASAGPGQNTQYADNFTFYNQCDPSWKDKPYGTGSTVGGCAGPNTIGTDGCGPTVMAMIITVLTGQQITPDQTAAYATSQNLYEPGVGSSWSIATVLSKKWNLTAKPLGANVAQISAALQNGSLVIAAGTGPAPFTGGGHFIVIRAITSGGKWKVADPVSADNNNKTWDPQQIISTINSPASQSAGSIYAISK